MDPIHLIVWGTVALAVLGLFIGVAGVFNLFKAPRRRRGIGLTIFGLVILGAVGVLVWTNWPLFLQRFGWDVVNPELREELQNASLNDPDRDKIQTRDWPQWRGPFRDGFSPAKGLLDQWPAGGPKVVWRKPIKGGYSSVSIANGRAYVTDRDRYSERVICLDAADGKELWVHRYDAEYRGMQYGAGPRATPTVHDGRIHTVGAGGVFLCLDANPKDGKPNVLWEHNLLEEFEARRPTWGVACSPLVEGDLVVVQPGGGKGSVAAFDRVTGKLAWTALDDESGYSSPVAATAAGQRQVIAVTAAHLAGLEPPDGHAP